MKNVQRKIKNSVELYQKHFADEYKLVVEQIKEVRESLESDFADLEGNHVLKRELFRTPEKLYNLFISNLSATELKYMDTDAYAKWFIKEFPEFRITKYD